MNMWQIGIIVLAVVAIINILGLIYGLYQRRMAKKEKAAFDAEYDRLSARLASTEKAIAQEEWNLKLRSWQRKKGVK